MAMGIMAMNVAATVPDTSILEACNGSSAQQLSFDGGMVRSLENGHCLDGTCTDISKGCYPLDFKPCSSSTAFLQWDFDAENRFISVAHNRSACLDVYKGGNGLLVTLACK